MAETIKINRESDFDFVLNTYMGDVPIDITKYDFRLVFFTDNVNKYECSKIGEAQTNIQIEEGKIRCVFDNHGLGCGRIKVKVYQNIANSLYPDGYKLTVTPQELPIILWTGKSDDSPILDVDLYLSRLDEIDREINKIKDALTWK